MISLFVFIVVFLIAAILTGALKKSTYSDAGGRFRISGLMRIMLPLIIAVLAIMINPVDVERIDAGHVGIKVSNVGDNRGVGKTEYVTGWVIFNSWISKIYEFRSISNI